MAGAGDIQGKPGSVGAGVPRRVGRDELDTVLGQALAQGCTELVLLGPGAWDDRRVSAEESPGRLVLQVRARSIAIPDFQDFGQLRSLAIVDLALDDRWAAVIASSLRQLTSSTSAGTASAMQGRRLSPAT